MTWKRAWKNLHKKKGKRQKEEFLQPTKKMVKLPAAQKLCQQYSCQNRQFAMRYPVSIVLTKSWLENLLKWNLKIYKMTLLGLEKTLYLHRKKGNGKRRNFYNRRKKWSNYLLLKSYVNNTPVIADNLPWDTL